MKFPKEWSGQRLASRWEGSRAGGTPLRQTPAQVERWSQNPQAFMTIQRVDASKKTHIFVSLGQDDGRSKADGTSAFPFVEHIYSIVICVLKIGEDDEIPLKKFNSQRYFLSFIKIGLLNYHK